MHFLLHKEYVDATTGPRAERRAKRGRPLGRPPSAGRRWAARTLARAARALEPEAARALEPEAGARHLSA